jgi:voltage-dependent anion channel protein 2
MEVGAKYYLLGGGFIKAKLDNAGRLGIAIASDLRPGMQLTLGASVDTNKLAENNHKVGLELSYSA